MMTKPMSSYDLISGVNQKMSKRAPKRPGPDRHSITTLKECKEHMKAIGYTYSHRSINGDYVFFSDACDNCIGFSLTELRHAHDHGF